MHIHLLQMAIRPDDPEANRARVRELLRAAPAGGLVLLPEMFSTGFPASADREPALDPAEADRAFLAGLARERGGWILGTTIARDGARWANLGLLHGPGGTLHGSYRKIHPFGYGGEDRHFAGGGRVEVWDWEGFRLQPSICYDLRFPELYRAGNRRGADLITVQANWPSARQEHWDTLLRARAIENQAFAAGVNCVGERGRIRYAGGSAVYSPKGEALVRAGEGEGVWTAEADPAAIALWRRQFPVHRDRKPDGFYA